LARTAIGGVIAALSLLVARAGDDTDKGADSAVQIHTFA